MPPATTQVLKTRRSRRRARRLRVVLELVAVILIAALTAWIVSGIAMGPNAVVRN